MTKKRYIGYIPPIGILLFVGLYVYASMLYPGGSQVNSSSVGFDWVNNYWCNLMSVDAINNQHNPARPFAIIAMSILSFSLMVFFIQFAQIRPIGQIWKRLIQACGIASMVSASFIFTSYHDTMSILTGIFGLVVIIGIIREVYRSGIQFYITSGILCIILLGINNYIYFSQHYIELLPLLQKITFVLVLSWVLGLNYTIHYRDV